MSPQPASRGNPNPILTLAHVILAVGAADIPTRRRQEITAALRTVARALRKPPDRVSADPRRLAEALKEVAPLAIGMSVGRWANVRSLTRAGLALVQPMSPGRHITPLSPGWKGPWKQLPRPVRMALSRFARFCTVHGIEPEAVTEATFEAFRAHLNDSLLKSPDKIFAALVRGWRSAQTVVDGWPRIGIAIPNRRRDWTLPWSDFPASLRQDCEAWRDRLAGRDLLAEGHVRVVRPGTVVRRERQIRTVASALVRQGRDPSTITSLRDLVEIEALKTARRSQVTVSPGSAAARGGRGLPRGARGKDARASAARLGDDPEQSRQCTPDTRRTRERHGTAARGSRGLPRGARGKDARASAARLGADSEQPRQCTPHTRRTRERHGAAARGGRRLRRVPNGYRDGFAGRTGAPSALPL
jgi:hypothetical protein